MVIEGDSQSSTLPDQPTNRDAFYSYPYADDPANAMVTFHVRAQASRTVGGGEASPQSTAGLTVPANGFAIGLFGEGGGASIGATTAGSGTTLIDEGQVTYQSETFGIAVGTRRTSG